MPAPLAQHADTDAMDEARAGFVLLLYVPDSRPSRGLHHEDSWPTNINRFALR